MLIATLIILPLIPAAICLCTGIIGHTIDARKSFCRNCDYEINHRDTFCSECGTSVTMSSQALAFALNHPRLAELRSCVSFGKHKTYRGLITAGAMCFTLSLALIAATLYTGAHKTSWRAFVPSTTLLNTLQSSASLAHAKPTITELRRRADAGTLSPQLQAKLESIITTLTPSPAPLPSISASMAHAPIRSSYYAPRRDTPKRDRHAKPAPPNSDAAIFAQPNNPPAVRIIESWQINTEPRTITMGDEYSIPSVATPYFSRATPELLQRMQTDLKERGLASPDVLEEIDFEIRVPTFQRFGTVAPLYPGLKASHKPPRRAAAPVRATNPFSHAPRRVDPNRL